MAEGGGTRVIQNFLLQRRVEKEQKKVEDLENKLQESQQLLETALARREADARGASQEDAPTPTLRKVVRSTSSLRLEAEEAAALELENRQLRRRVAELEEAAEKVETAGASKEKPKVKKHLALLQAVEESEDSDEEADLKQEKRMKAIMLSGKWRKFAEGLRRIEREQDMEDIEAENEELKDKVHEMEEKVKQVKHENHRLLQQIQDDIRVQGGYKDALEHAHQQLETAHMECDIQRSKVHDLQEMLEQLELELSFAKMDVGSKSQKLEDVAPVALAEPGGPRLGRISVEEEADMLAKQLTQGSAQIAPEFVARCVQLIKSNLVLQRKLSGLLEWRSEATVSKLQGELTNEASLVKSLRSKLQSGGRVRASMDMSASNEVKAACESQINDLKAQCYEMERLLQRERTEAAEEEAQRRAELREQDLELQAMQESEAQHQDELQSLEASLADTWRVVREEVHELSQLREGSVEQRLEEAEATIEAMSSFTNEAESNIEGLTKEHQLLEERCQALTTSERSKLLANVASLNEMREGQEQHAAGRLEKDKELLESRCHVLEAQEEEIAAQLGSLSEAATVEKGKADSLVQELAAMRQDEMEEAARSKGLDGSDSVSALEERYAELSEAHEKVKGELQQEQHRHESCVTLESEIKEQQEKAVVEKRKADSLVQELAAMQQEMEEAARSKGLDGSDSVSALEERYAQLSEAHEKVKGELQQQQHWHERCVTLESEIKEQQEKAKAELKSREMSAELSVGPLEVAQAGGMESSPASLASPASPSKQASFGSSLAALRRARASISGGTATAAVASGAAPAAAPAA
ncbi:unnamed protein product, partial [Effrenium voratum]